jgi:hypothetical protein
MQFTGMAGGADFSAYGIKQRFNVDYQAAKGNFTGRQLAQSTT